MSVLLFVVFLTIFISAQCALYEATLYSTRLARIKKIDVSLASMNLTRGDLFFHHGFTTLIRF
jgi:hypothetical protein